MLDKMQVREQVLTCTACDLERTCSAPVPFFGPTPSTCAVLGEAPGKQEDQQGIPFVGPAGKLLKNSMQVVGLNPARFVYLNTVSCYPQTAEGRGRTPMLGEVNACSDNKEQQLLTIQAKWVILTGNVPLQSFRPDLRIGRLHGQPMLWKEMVLFPIYHPAAVLRNRGWVGQFEDDLQTFKEMLERDSWTWLNARCCHCGKPEEDMEMLHVDTWNVNYCEGCWK